MDLKSSIIKDIRETAISQKCPACGHSPMESIIAVLDLPMLGEAIETTIKCPKCGFKRSDVMITAQNEPIRYTMEIKKEEDINARVVRSSSGTIRIPELGIVIEPGPASEAFISNIEGVLMRARDVLEGLDYEDGDAVKVRMERIDEARNGHFRFTFIIEDPFGNSAIISEKAKKEVLKPEEVKHLRRGELDINI